MDAIKDFFNFFADPRVFFLLTLTGFILMIWRRDVFTTPRVGYGLQVFLVLFFGLGLFDENFRLIVAKPDNVPIVGLVFLLLFFTWYSRRRWKKTACGCGQT